MAASPRELAQRLLELHLNQLRRHVQRNGIGPVSQLYRNAEVELSRRLRSFPNVQSLDALNARLMYAQVEAVLLALSRDLNELLRTSARSSAELGVQQGLKELTRLSQLFTGALPIVDVGVPAVLSGLVSRVESSLLRRYQLQSQRWALATIEGAERQLAAAAMTRKSLFETVRDLTGPQGIGATRYEAERIVRTEMSYAHGAAKMEGLKETEQETGVKLHKKILEHFDDRTGDDSFLLQGQTVPLDQPFTWKHKRKGQWMVVEYMHPPNRPNDRAVVIPWDPSWEEGADEKPLSRAQLAAAAPTRWRKTAGVKIPPGHKPGQPYPT